MTEITFSAFPDAILALSVDGKIDFANPAAEELLKRLGSEIGLPLRIREEAENVLKGAADYMPTSFEKAVAVRINELAMLFEGKCEGLDPTQAARKFGYTK